MTDPPASSPLQTQIPFCNITPDSELGKLTQVHLQHVRRTKLQYAVFGVRPATQRPTQYFPFLRDGEAKTVDQVDTRQHRCIRHHIDTVVIPQAELVILPLGHVFKDQPIPPFGDRHSPDERGGAIRSVDL